MSKEYRIIRRPDGRYYPQRKRFWWWFDCHTHYAGMDIGSFGFKKEEYADQWVKQRLHYQNASSEVVKVYD